MALSDTRQQELAALEPPRSLERIVRFLEALGVRASAPTASFGGPEVRIGRVGLAAANLTTTLAERGATFTAAPVGGWAAQLMTAHQVGVAEIREFAFWLAQWNERRAAMEVQPEEPSAEGKPIRVSTLADRAPERTYSRRTAGEETGEETLETERPPGHRMTISPERKTAELEARREGRRPRGTEPPPPTVWRAEAENRTGRAYQRPPAAERDAYQDVPPQRRPDPDALSRAWQEGRAPGSLRRPVSVAAVQPAAPSAPPVAERLSLTDRFREAMPGMNRAVWTTNLGLGGFLGGVLQGRAAAEETAPFVSAAGRFAPETPAAVGERERAALDFPLSRSPMPQASWTGQAPAAPIPVQRESRPTITLPFEVAPTPTPLVTPESVRLMPSAVILPPPVLEPRLAPPGLPLPTPPDRFFQILVWPPREKPEPGDTRMPPPLPLPVTPAPLTPDGEPPPPMTFDTARSERGASRYAGTLPLLPLPAPVTPRSPLSDIGTFLFDQLAIPAGVQTLNSLLNRLLGGGGAARGPEHNCAWHYRKVCHAVVCCGRHRAICRRSAAGDAATERPVAGTTERGDA